MSNESMTQLQKAMKHIALANIPLRLAMVKNIEKKFQHAHAPELKQ